MSTDGQLDADGVRALFRELSDRLAEAGVAAQLFVVDDTALVVAHRVIFPDIERFLTAILRTTRRVYVITQASLPSSLVAAGALRLRLPSSGGSGATDAVGAIALIDALVADIARRHPDRATEARTLAQAYRDEFRDDEGGSPARRRGGSRIRRDHPRGGAGATRMRRHDRRSHA